MARWGRTVATGMSSSPVPYRSVLVVPVFWAIPGRASSASASMAAAAV